MMYSLFLTFSYFFLRLKRITTICLEQMFVSVPTLESHQVGLWTFIGNSGAPQLRKTIHSRKFGNHLTIDQ